MAEHTTGVGVSRRRIIQGAAWATPAVLIATALPVAAVSAVPPGRGITVYQATAARETAHGGGGVPANTPALTTSFRLHNAGKYDAPPTPAATSVSVAVIVPIGSIAAPLWGVGTSGIGVSLPAGWVLVGGAPTISGGNATFTFGYTGDPGDDVGLDNIWVQRSATAATSGSVLFNSSATHVGGATSSDSAIRTFT